MSDEELEVTIFKLLGTRHSAKRWKEYGQFALILLAIAGIIGLVGALQMVASKLP